MRSGAVNAWKCDACGLLTVAVHVDEGVTPMVLACRRVEGCPGMGKSLFYVPLHPDVVELLAWEWYRPTERWTRRQDPEMRRHIEQGGLVIRPLTDAGRVLCS